ncbi:uncharacterized protein LOC141817832, partial [Curcuma longa]|uniref:uncharacterized protein LOC141817832 n=1 Tax=Curcuma longa TaxID=136217 RepID=UPI003D9F7322
MAQQEGYSTVRPPLFTGEDFGYWKGRMENFLKIQFEMWMIVKTGFELPIDGDGKPTPCENWDLALIKKVEANARATCTLQCGLTKEELNRVGPFSSAKELWEKLIELHEGTSDTKEGETATQLHARIQDLLNGLHAIGQKVDNRDIIRYSLNAFPRNTLWASMVDAYKVSKDLSSVKLDELFAEFELHEQINSRPAEK